MKTIFGVISKKGLLGTCSLMGKKELFIMKQLAPIRKKSIINIPSEILCLIIIHHSLYSKPIHFIVNITNRYVAFYCKAYMYCLQVDIDISYCKPTCYCLCFHFFNSSQHTMDEQKSITQRSLLSNTYRTHCKYYYSWNMGDPKCMGNF